MLQPTIYPHPVRLLVDSACDLPAAFIQEYGISVIPFSIRVGERRLVDDRNEARFVEALTELQGTAMADAESIPPTPAELVNWLRDYSYYSPALLALTISSTRSKLFDNLCSAFAALPANTRTHRVACGLARELPWSVTDSRSIFAAQGVMAARCAVMAQGGSDLSTIVSEAEWLKPFCRTLGVLPDLGYIRARAKAKGDHSVGLLSVFLGSALDIKPIIVGHLGETKAVEKVRGFDKGCQRVFQAATTAISRGLATPYITVSYGGSSSLIPTLAGFSAFQAAAEGNGVKLLLAAHSLTASVNIGPGALTVGLATDFDPMK